MCSHCINNVNIGEKTRPKATEEYYKLVTIDCRIHKLNHIGRTNYARLGLTGMMTMWWAATLLGFGPVFAL